MAGNFARETHGSANVRTRDRLASYTWHKNTQILAGEKCSHYLHVESSPQQTEEVDTASEAVGRREIKLKKRDQQ